VADNSRLPGPLTGHWAWQLEAACRGMDSAAFFHPTEERPAARRERLVAAKKVCAACPVVSECLSHALTTREPYGIWGGLSEIERADLLGLSSLRYPARRFTDPADAPADAIPIGEDAACTSDGQASGKPYELSDSPVGR
jgi:WhiB family redox-sensing transcriptional regulator